MTFVPEIVIALSNMHLPAGQLAWNTTAFRSVIAVAPPGAVTSYGLFVTMSGALLFVNGPFIDVAVA
jgi:hypothetical protein